MITKIRCEDLKPGMYVVNTGLDWRKFPYVYSTEKAVDAAAIAAALAEGYLEAFIDTERSAAQQSSLLGDIWGTRVSNPAPLTAVVSFKEELPLAQAAFDACLGTAKKFMDDFRVGNTVDVAQSEPMVKQIISSVARNPDALIGISKLRYADDYTYSHCVNVAVLSTMFVRYLGFSEKTQHAVGMAGMFHDVGKSFVPSEILNAPRKLSDEEFAIMKSHPQKGYDELCAAPGFTNDMLRGILEHHERFNGTGYPQRLAGDKISLIGRILAIVDVYDALTSRRVYKEPMPSHQVLAMMYKMRGVDFYPGFAEHYARMIGIYPVGSVVELVDGSRGVISASNSEKPTKPKVRLVQNALGRTIPNQEWDIAKGECAEISRCLLAGESSISAQQVLGVPVRAFHT